MATVVGTARRALKWERRWPQVWLAAAMVATVAILMIAHIAEVGVWALAYSILDVAPPGADVVYFAFVNYTTLGYGDVVPLERWRMLGPMAAMNGVLLFGWSTAVIFEVLRQPPRPDGRAVIAGAESVRFGKGSSARFEEVSPQPKWCMGLMASGRGQRYAKPCAARLSSSYRIYRSGHRMWTSTAADVTACVDEAVPGRMYSGPAYARACLTMRAPDWYPISPGP
jgi:hypothetical protein